MEEIAVSLKRKRDIGDLEIDCAERNRGIIRGLKLDRYGELRSDTNDEAVGPLLKVGL